MLPSVYGSCNQQGGVTMSVSISQIQNNTSISTIPCFSPDLIPINTANNYSISSATADYTIIGGEAPFTLAWTFATSLGANITLIAVAESGDPGGFIATATVLGPCGAVTVTLDVTDSLSATAQANCGIRIDGSV